MNKEQQIEEIEQFIYDYVDSKQTEKVYLFSSRVIEFVKLAKPFTHNKGIAEALYNAGYRQIDENCAVITKAELKEYKRQAVKEFADKLKDKYDYDEDSYGVPVIPMYKIGETLKEMEDES